MTKFSNNFYKLSGWLFIIFLWSISSRITGNTLLFPTLDSLIESLFNILKSSEGYNIIFNSLKTMFAAIFTALILGGGAAFFSKKFSSFKYFIEPLMIILKSLPTVGIILLIMIWSRLENVPFFIGTVISIGTIYDAFYGAFLGMDEDLRYMCRIYEVSLWDRISGFYLPSLYYSVSSLIPTIFSLTLKVVIAGEILAQIDNSIGGELFYQKTLFNTEIFFAWLMLSVIIILGIQFFLNLIDKKLNRWRDVR